MWELIKNFGIYGIGNVISKFMSFFLLPIYTSVFTPTEYGYLDLIITASSILSVFGLLQIETGFQRFYYETDIGKRADYIFTNLLFVFICSIFFVIIGIVLSPLISDLMLGGFYTKVLILSFITLIPQNLLTMCLIVMNFQGNAKQYSALTILNILISASLTILLIVIFKIGILGVFIATFFSTTFIFLLSLWIIRHLIGNKVEFKILHEELKFSIPQFPARIGSISNVYLNRFFMLSRFSPAAIGLFSVGLKFAGVMNLILGAFQISWIPYMYKIAKQENHQEQIRKIQNGIVDIILLLVLIITLFSSEIVQFVANQSYYESSSIIGILSLSIGLYVFKVIAECGIQLSNKTKFSSYSYLSSLGLNVLLLVLVPPSWGIMGISLTMLFTNLFLFYASLFFSEYLYPIQFDKFAITAKIAFFIPTIIFMSYNQIDFFFKLLIFLSILLYITKRIYPLRNHLKNKLKY